MSASANYDLPQPLLEAMTHKRYASCLDTLRDLAAQDSQAAYIALGHIYFHGGDGISKDYKAARYWLTQLSPEYDVTGLAATLLGAMYAKGLGVAVDHRRAFGYLRRAVLSGKKSGLLVAAIMQTRGDGTLKKPRTAQTIFRRFVCDKRMSTGKRMLALLYVSPWTKPLTISNGKRASDQ